MIVGIGTDIIEVVRMHTSLERHGETFAKRILHPEELSQFQQVTKKDQFLAKRFAVKEAASKALGTGFAEGVSWQHIYLRHDALGKPLLHFEGEAERLAVSMGVTRKHVSVSDEKAYAVAFVLLES